jgi:hypothetical protein
MRNRPKQFFMVGTCTLQEDHLRQYANVKVLTMEVRNDTWFHQYSIIYIHKVKGCHGLFC